MPPHSHPPRESPDWTDPDFCPFCGEKLTDGGGGFIDHIEEAPACEERFESWREGIVDDIDGEWSG